MKMKNATHHASQYKKYYNSTKEKLITPEYQCTHAAIQYSSYFFNLNINFIVIFIVQF